MSLDKYYTETFIPYSWTASAAWPFEPTWTAGTAFKGAIDMLSSRDRWADGQVFAGSTHMLFCKTSQSLTKGMRIGWSSRTFEIMGYPDAIPLKTGHHQEIYLKEITS
jgi:head-tail adaptor